jgi:hypothetical protein
MSAATTSFYQTGGNLPLNAPSYVERQADTDLYEGLSRGEFCYMLTARQMGKSSLMVLPPPASPGRRGGCGLRNDSAGPEPDGGTVA